MIIPICFVPGLCYIVSCYVVDKLSSKLILGMELLTSVNPTIWWVDYEVGLAFDNSVVMLHRISTYGKASNLVSLLQLRLLVKLYTKVLLYGL